MSETTIQTEKANAVIDSLKVVLADSYALLGQTHLAHWNVEGPSFFQLHEAFEEQYKELFEAVDEVAERIRALGEYAPGGLKTLADHSQITEMAVGSAPAKDFVAHLIDGHETTASNAKDARDKAEAAGDLETQDLMIGRIQDHEKALWMLKSFLKNL